MCVCERDIEREGERERERGGGRRRNERIKYIVSEGQTRLGK